MKWSLSSWAGVLLLSAVVSLGENWPRFRGPTGQGISSETAIPSSWSPGEGIKWKTSIPGESWSSPIVWGDSVFLTTTVEMGQHCHVLCIDRKNGEIRWNKKVFEQVPLRKEGKNSYASSTPVTDGKSVFAVFGDGSVAALDFNGQILWTNRDVKFYSQHGLGASPVLYRDLLIMPFDGSSTGEDKTVGWQKPWDKSFINAYDIKTGKVRWTAKRGMSRIAHVTPNLLVENGETQLISGAGDVVQGFNPDTGELIWTAASRGEGVVPSIVIGNGLIFSASGFEKSTIRAMKTGGKGDVTETHIVWEQTKGVPSLSSFVLHQDYLFAITDGGVASCLEAKTGKQLWQERVGGKHSASPVLVDGKIYFLSEEGETAMIEPGPEFKILGRNSINEKCQASMAISQGNIFIRSEKKLFCIGK
ncbi:MAG: PQQ-binding-like beta-propeller repeat protein [Verrucomicrobiota bacterium]|nr:PQQ-binding-like beta-propeller repeat protein [Verrucomicrobiota bacterium]